MKVTLAKHGGLAAAINLHRPPLVVETDRLPKAAADELARLVAAIKAVAAEPPNDARAGRGGDVMSYTITLEDEKAPMVVTQSDTAMSPAFATLLAWLEKFAARQ